MTAGSPVPNNPVTPVPDAEHEKSDEQLDVEAKIRWGDESPAPDPDFEITHDPDDSPDQPNDES